MLRSSAVRDVIQRARDRATSEFAQWEKDWVNHAWRRGTTGDEKRDEAGVWAYCGGDPVGFNFTDRTKWPDIFQRLVNRLLPCYDERSFVYEFLLECCTRTVEDGEERAMLLKTLGSTRNMIDTEELCKTVADIPRGLAHFRKNCVPPGIGNSPAWSYGYVQKCITQAIKGACPHGVPHTDPVVDDFKKFDWMRNLTEAVMVAVGICITWVQPLYNVPTDVGLSRPALRTLQTAMAKRREQWTIKNFGRFRATLWESDKEEAQRLLRVGLEWGKAHTPITHFLDDGPHLLFRLDLTVSLGFLLKFAALHESDQSFVDALSPDMKEHIDTWCRHTTYSAWSSAIKECIVNEDRLIEEGGYPLYRTVPLEEDAARAADAIVVQAAHRKFFDLHWRGPQFFNPMPFIRWICPKLFIAGDTDVGQQVWERIVENRDGRNADRGVLYDPNTHDSSAFTYSMGTQPGDVLLPAHELVAFIREALDTLDALKDEKPPSTSHLDISCAGEARLFWYAHTRSRAAMDGLNPTTMKENLVSLRDGLQDKHGLYARRDAMLEGEDPTSTVISKRLRRLPAGIHPWQQEDSRPAGGGGTGIPTGG